MKTIPKILLVFLLLIPASHLWMKLETKAIATYYIAKSKLTAYLLTNYAALPDIKNLVAVEAAARGLNPHLAFAVVEQESNWNSTAVRHEPRLGTMTVGLFQIMPSTAKACPGSPTATQLFHPVTNTKCGIFLLSSYLKKTGSPRKTLVAYNGGEGCLTHRCSGAESYATSVLTKFSEKLM